MTNKERRKLDENKRIADELCGKKVHCIHGHEVGQVVEAAANKDGVIVKVKGKEGGEAIVEILNRR